MLVSNSVSTPCVLWLDPQLPAPDDGDVIAENEGVWQTWKQTNAFPNASFGPHVTTYYMTPTPQSNGVDTLPTAATRKETSGVNTMPFLPDGVNYQATNYYSPRRPLTTNNFPLGQLFYGVASTNLSAEWTGGNIWTRQGLGTNVYKYRFETFVRNATDDYLRVNMSISTQKLNEAKTVLQTMTRSMWIGDYNQATVSTCKLWTAYVSNVTNLSVDVTQEGEASAPPDVSEAFFASGLSDLNASWTDGGLSSFSGTLLSLEIECDHNLTEFFWEYFDDDDHTDWNRYLNYTGNADSYALQGCRLPYPSEYACASGYVGKVTIFGVFAPDIYPNPVHYANVYHGYSNSTYYADGANAVFDADTYGVCNYLSPLPVASESLDFSIGNGVYMQAIDCLPSEIVLSKIAEFDNPTTRPVFDLGISSPTINSTLATIHYWTSVVEGREGIDRTTDKSEWWQKGKRQRLRLLKFVVVVDWKWKHLNDANPYDPTPFTPIWVTNNVVTNGF
jgi:hypothetical protein